MKNHKIILMSLILILFMGWIGVTQAPSETRDTLERQYATGVVFHDKNENGILDRKEKGIPRVRISNGREVVETDRKGNYKISVTEDTIVFVIKPKGWITPFNANHLPKFYYIHKPQGSPSLEYKGVKPTGSLPDSVNFPLYPHRELKRFQTVFLGDTQVYSQEQLNFLAHDSVEELVGIDAAFGVTLGDIVGDRLSLLKPVSKTIGRIGIPWYNVIGNHDRNYDAPNFDSRDDTFERIFGPSVYSYDWGEVHFINLNDIFSLQEKWKYKGRLTQKILDFVRNDLAFVPRKKLIVLMMHIPLSGVENAEDLYRLIEDRPYTFSISAHYHTQQHLFVGEKQGWKGKEPHHHLINGTACGSWWQGAFDEVGIPHAMMADGAPKGYSLITFDGNQYSIRYKASRRPVDYQMNIFAPEVDQSRGGFEH